MNTFGNKLYVGLCIVIGLLSSFLAFYTASLMGDVELVRFGYGVALGLVLASGWGACSLFRGKFGPFTTASTFAFGGSVLFQLVTSFSDIIHFTNPEISIFVVTVAMLVAGITYCVKAKEPSTPTTPA